MRVEGLGPDEIRDWTTQAGDVPADQTIALEIVEFIERHGALSVVMTGGIIGCPNQEGIDYEGQWCPACQFLHGRDRFTGKRVI